MPTTITKSVGSAGGRDYATWALWEAALPASLVTEDEVWIGEGYEDSEFTVAGVVLDIAGITMDATRYAEARPASGQGFSGNPLRYDAANGVALRNTAGYAGSAVALTAAHARVKGLQFRGSGAASSGISTANVAGLIIDSCISETSGASSAAFGMDIRGNATHAKNCLAINAMTGGTIRGVRTREGADFSNCTIVRPTGLSGTAGVAVTYAYGYGNSAQFKNCAFFGFGATFQAGASTAPTYTTGATDNASPPTGVTGSLTYADQFEGIATGSRDYRLKAGNDLENAGTDLADPTVDIIGTARTTDWDIGCWEVAGGGDITGTGALTAGGSDIEGAGVSGSTGTGAASAGASGVSGSGSSVVSGSGALSAGAGDLAGAGVSGSTGAGSPAAGACDADGSGSSSSTGTGGLVCSADVEGAGVSGSTGTGALTAQAARVTGSEAFIEAVRRARRSGFIVNVGRLMGR